MMKIPYSIVISAVFSERFINVLRTLVLNFCFVVLLKSCPCIFRITFGFMGVTGFLSMWLANIPTTAMMIPIAAAVLTALNDHRMLLRDLRSKKRCTHTTYYLDLCCIFINDICILNYFREKILKTRRRQTTTK